MITILLAGLLSSFVVTKDPMTDQLTYKAVLAQKGSVSLSVECGPYTSNSIAIIAEPGFSLFESRITSGPNRFTTKIRFDDAPPLDVKIVNDGDVAVVTGDKQMVPLLRLFQSSSKVVLEVTDYSGNPAYMMASITDDGRAAVAEVARRCNTPTGKN